MYFVIYLLQAIAYMRKDSYYLEEDVIYRYREWKFRIENYCEVYEDWRVGKALLKLPVRIDYPCDKMYFTISLYGLVAIRRSVILNLFSRI